MTRFCDLFSQSMTAVLAAIVACSLFPAAVARPAPARLSAGSLAPQFSRIDLDGRQFDLKAYRGKVVLIDFWASWCPPCMTEIPHLIDLQRRYGPKGFQVVAISMDDSVAPVKALTHRFVFNYPVLLGDAKFGNLYGGILGLPVQFLIGPNGKIVRIWSGDLNPAILEKAIKSAVLLQN